MSSSHSVPATVKHPGWRHHLTPCTRPIGRALRTLIFAGATVLPVAPVSAAADLDIQVITWDVIGLDSNKPTTDGPTDFPLAVRVKNAGPDVANNVVVMPLLGAGNPNVKLEGVRQITTGSLAVGQVADFYFEVVISRPPTNQGNGYFSSTNNAASRRSYKVEAKADNSTTASTIDTTPNRQLFVEKILSQNRNSVAPILEVDFPDIPFLAGQIRTFTLYSDTATGYDQQETTINFPTDLFQILSVKALYTDPACGCISNPKPLDLVEPLPATPNRFTTNKVYVDGCGWRTDSTVAGYMTSNNFCTDPETDDESPTGKIGGTIVTTYKVLVVKTVDRDVDLDYLVHDHSGSSFHYNFETDLLTIRATNIMVEKSALEDPVQAGQEFSYLITVCNTSTRMADDVVLTDSLPMCAIFADADPPPVNAMADPLRWELGTLNPMECVDIIVTATATCDIGLCENIATVSTSDLETNYNDNEDDAVINIQDTTPPEIECVPDIIIDCTESTDPTNTGETSATDVCGILSLSHSDVSMPGCDNTEVTTRTWTATDVNGNISTCTQLITSTDTTDPELVGVPNDVTVECDDVPDTASVSATDNCDAVVPVSVDVERINGDCADSYQLIRTWTAVDDCGNDISDSQTITVEDTTSPVLSGVPQNVTVECDDIPDTATVTATDNCDTNVPVVPSVVRVNGECLDTYQLIRTWTATDNCGNETSASQTVFVEDTTSPTLIGVPDDDAVECDDIPDTATVTARDNCDTNVPVTVDEEILPGNCPDSYVIVRTWTAIDNCGNETSASQNIVVDDTTDPVLGEVPNDVTIQCSDNVPTTATVTAMDNCDADVEVTVVERLVDGNCPDSYQIIRTWTATDNCGNDVSDSQIINVIDTIAPMLTGVPVDTTVDCDDIPATATVTAIDNCDTSVPVSISYRFENGGCSARIFRTWTALDDCGNETSATQTITVQDIGDPTLTGVPDDTTVECDDIPDTATVTARDDCDPDVPVSVTVERIDGDCPDSYQLVRTWTAIDDCENDVADSQIITVIDTTSPTLSGVPQNVTVECDDIPDTATVTATDNCDTSVPVVASVVQVDGECLDTYQLIRTWTATDNCGNETSASQTIFVEDTTSPTLIGVPDDDAVECDDIPDTATVTARDNCDTNVPVTVDEEILPGNCPDSYVIVRTWTAIDNCGNETSASQNIAVDDTTDPVLGEVPNDVTIQCSDNVPTTATVTAMDNCDADVEVTVVERLVDGNCPDSYQIIRTWTATDNCGNDVSDSQTINVIDTVAPMLTGVPVDTTVDCDDIPATATVTAIDNCDTSVPVSISYRLENGGCNYRIFRTWTAIDDCGNETSATQLITVRDVEDPELMGIPENVTVECDDIPDTATVTAMDDCDPNVPVSVDVERIDGNCADSYQLIRTWTAEDDCENEVSASQIITVVDTTSPTLVGVPQSVTVECDEVPSTATVTATDNCDTSVPVVATVRRVNGDCLDNYQLVRTWTATDNCGNETSASQTITVEDTTDPVLGTIPDDITIECDDDIPTTATVTAEDNCDADVDVDVIERRVDGNCPDSYQIIRTWTATDNCGNDVSDSQTINIVDTTDPVLAGVPANTTAECDDIPATATVTATDNCDTSVPVGVVERRVDGNCPASYTLLRTWTAIDNCGNETSATQTIEVQDTTDPVLSGVPMDETVMCDDIPDTATVTAMDNCDPNVPVIATVQVFNGKCNYEIVRTWTATDDCGNETSASQTITVQDMTDPVLSGVPMDATVECDAVPTTATVTATDICDPDVPVRVTERRIDGQCPDSYQIVRTWTAIDMCENETSASQTITVRDTTKPELVGVPEGTTAECDDIPDTATVTATDNCDDMVPVSVSVERIDGLLCPESYTLVRTWSATDDCGNMTSRTQIIDVVDTTDPMLSGVPNNVTVQCDNVPATATVTATDNCDTSVPVTVSEQRTAGACPDSYTIVRTWTAVDNCGNDVSRSQTITVQDTMDPVLSGVPDDTTVECDDIPDTATVTATDNCDTSVPVTVTVRRENGNCPDNYRLIRTWTAVDNCGNDVTDSQIITVRDTTDPMLSGVPDDVTVECDDIPDTATVTATDNCDTSVPVTVTVRRENGNCADNYRLIRTWTAVDNCGNDISESQTITVEDTTDPVLGPVPEDETVECDDVPVAATVTATDNCDANVAVTMKEQRTNGSCPDSYTLVRTWTAVDNCGNDVSDSQTITVEDTTPPVIDCPDNIVVPGPTGTDTCVVVTYQGSATDNCDDNVPVSYSVPSGSCFECGTATSVTLRATDDCGNETSCTFTVTVGDCPDQGCSLTQGYWKNHEEDWPVESLMLGNRVYSKAECLRILRTPVQGNGLISLAHQLIATKLNGANEASITCISGVIMEADDMIGNLVIPPIGGGYLASKDTAELNNKLDDYNNGRMCVPHCDSMEPDPVTYQE